MAQPNKGPRLYLYQRKGRASTWVIRHGTKSFGVGDNRARAELALQAYISSPKHFRTKQKKRWGRTDPNGIVWLYVAEVEAGERPVKIGIANDVRARLWNIRVGSPFPINLVASAQIQHSLEAVIHQRLASSLIRGEWFTRTIEVSALIEAIWADRLYEFLGAGDAVPSPSAPVPLLCNWSVL